MQSRLNSFFLFITGMCMSLLVLPEQRRVHSDFLRNSRGIQFLKKFFHGKICGQGSNVRQNGIENRVWLTASLK